MGYVVTNSSFILSIIVYGEIALLNGCNIGNYSGDGAKNAHLFQEKEYSR